MKQPQKAERDQLDDIVTYCRKRLRQDGDLLSAKQEQTFRQEIQNAQNALTANAPDPARMGERLVSSYERSFPSCPRSDWVESLFVALVIAMAVRAFFLQPFKIPTGSMQPTLNGITVHSTQGGEKEWWYRFIALPIFGQNLIRVTATSSGEFTGVEPARLAALRAPLRGEIFPSEGVALNVGAQNYLAPIEPRVFRNDVTSEKIPGIAPLLKYNQHFEKGDAILDCVRQTGDYLFVDRFTYNFRKPRRGDVFVFETDNLRQGRLVSNGKSQVQQGVSSPGEFYIKRLAGLPGDTLQIKDPDLYINGAKIAEPLGFVRVMSLTDGYRGYTTSLEGMQFLNGPDETFKCGDQEYFALGDNSYFSQDSRFWGPVPYKNIVGRGFFVHWPFTRHFGRVD